MLLRTLFLLVAVALFGCGGNSDSQTTIDDGISGQPENSLSDQNQQIDMESMRTAVYELAGDLSFAEAVSTSLQGDHAYTVFFTNNRLVSKASLGTGVAHCAVSVRVGENVDPEVLSVSKGIKLRLITIQKEEDKAKKNSKLSLGISYPNPFLRALVVECSNVYSMSDFNAQIGKTITAHPKGTVVDSVGEEPDRPRQIRFQPVIDNYKFVHQSNFLIEDADVTNFEDYGSGFYAVSLSVVLQNQEIIKIRDIDTNSSYCEISYRFNIIAPPVESGRLTVKELKSFYFFDQNTIDQQGFYTKKSGTFVGPYTGTDSTNFRIDMKYKESFAADEFLQLDNKSGQSLIAKPSNVLKLSCANTFTVEEVNGHIQSVLKMELDI